MNSSGYGNGQQTFDAPACVQNAMMTKDKKPFTYTPGGIDLTQIKSERMAKRLARNAQAEGASGQSQLNRPGQPQSPSASSTSATAAKMGAAAMGMPFQVLPPPPPPPMSTNTSSPGVGKKNNGNSPAPPPPPAPPVHTNFHTTNTLAPPTNKSSRPGSPSAGRKSPSPSSQRFEPPPMGFRPEIKIPANPMASLRKVAPPVEKNIFWKEAYIKERSKSPMPGENIGEHINGNTFITESTDGNSDIADNNEGLKKSTVPGSLSNSNTQHFSQPISKSPVSPISPTTQSQRTESPLVYQNQSPSTPQNEFRSVAPPQSPTVNVYTSQSNHTPGIDAATSQRTIESQFATFPQRAQKQYSALQNNQNTYQEQAPQNVPPQSVPWRTQRAPQQSSSEAPQAPTVAPHPKPLYNNVVDPKPTNVGSLFIAPLAPPSEPRSQHIVRQQLQKQQEHEEQDSPMHYVGPTQQQSQPQLRHPARWMTSQPPKRDQPEWVCPEESVIVTPSSLQRIKSLPPINQQLQPLRNQQPTSNGAYLAPLSATQCVNVSENTKAPTGLRLHINTASNISTNNNSAAPKERIVPIQLEQTPTYTPSQPHFNVQPGVKSTTDYVIRTPNQFVDQGYNSFPNSSQKQRHQNNQLLNAPRLIQQQQQQQGEISKSHIVPIAIETEGTGGHISNAHVVLQSNPRSAPVQSKAFRVLQDITDTAGQDPTPNTVESFVDYEPQLQLPQYARQMSLQEVRTNPNTDQMRRLRINQEQPQERNWSQDLGHIHPSEQQVTEPKMYMGSALPSRSFKILQAMTTPENAGPGQSDL